MVLFPVLLPAAITAVHAVRRTNRPGYAAGQPRNLAARRLAVPTAA
jgi:hypothetical protein